jgi:tetratricopeptide (TPR) repeat protein
MTGRCALILLLFGLFGDGAADQGRSGNALYEQGQYAAAESAYRDGLAALDDTTGAVYAALQNNLGAALHRQKQYAEARSAFRRATRAAPAREARVRALFNAGTAAAGLGQLREALEDYKEALLLDPTHQQARYNYEYLKRQLARQRGGGQPPPDVQPSAYARRTKQKAEALVAEQRYEAAAELMRKALTTDSTVAAYRDFMNRLDDIAQIAQTP